MTQIRFIFAAGLSERLHRRRHHRGLKQSAEFLNFPRCIGSHLCKTGLACAVFPLVAVVTHASESVCFHIIFHKDNVAPNEANLR